MYAEQKKLSLHEFNKRYPNFSKSDKEYNQLLEKKNKAEQEYKFVIGLITNIKRYVRTMDGYFSNLNLVP